MGRKERYLVGLDVGTSKIAAVVGEVTGSAYVTGFGFLVLQDQDLFKHGLDPYCATGGAPTPSNPPNAPPTDL